MKYYYIGAAVIFLMMFSIIIVTSFNEIVVVQNHDTQELTSQHKIVDLDTEYEYEVDEVVSHQNTPEPVHHEDKHSSENAHDSSEVVATIEQKVEVIVETEKPTEADVVVKEVDVIAVESATEIVTESDESEETVAITEITASKDTPVTKPLRKEAVTKPLDLLSNPSVEAETPQTAKVEDVKVEIETVEVIEVAPKIETNIAELSEKMIEWPQGKRRKHSKNSSYQALFGLWDLNYNSAENGAPCSYAKTQGFSCHRGKTGIESLREFNRPAVLTLRDDANQVQYATLKEMNETEAILVIAGKEQTVSLSQLERHWKGDYLFFWSVPEGYFEPLMPGDSGRAILWLSRRMLEINKHPEMVPHNHYDDALFDQIKAFQLDEGLDGDGIVGIRTLIHINQATSQQVPLLGSS